MAFTKHIWCPMPFICPGTVKNNPSHRSLEWILSSKYVKIRTTQNSTTKTKGHRISSGYWWKWLPELIDRIIGIP
uniref:Protein AFR n=1 Tax=Rhizophora mucronata TaxID=61149 RepID=A0A2P2KRB0_RHIMU